MSVSSQKRKQYRAEYNRWRTRAPLYKIRLSFIRQMHANNASLTVLQLSAFVGSFCYVENILELKNTKKKSLRKKI